jgi:hypothetical protein
MAALEFDVGYTEPRNRLTVAFRIILAIPHLIVSRLWAYLAGFLAVIQWFIIVFTGQRNQGIWNLQWSWLGYDSRVQSYVSLLYDVYPEFGTEPGRVPVRTALVFESDADRLTNGLRILWIIPAAILAWVIGIGAAVVGIISWFAIVITGRHPRGMWSFLQQAVRLNMRLEAYALLMTDTYPKFDPNGPVWQALPAGSPPPGYGYPPAAMPAAPGYQASPGYPTTPGYPAAPGYQPVPPPPPGAPMPPPPPPPPPPG